LKRRLGNEASFFTIKLDEMAVKRNLSPQFQNLADALLHELAVLLTMSRIKKMALMVA
jgi:hypothetical protein